MDEFDVTYPPKTDAGWDRWGRNLANVMTPTLAPSYGVTSAAAQEFASAVDDYAMKLAAATLPATISRYNTQLKRDSLEVLKAVVKPVVAILRTNPAVTAAQRTQLGVTTRAAPTPAQVPGRPDVMAVLTGPTSIRVIASDPATPTRRGLPRDVRTLALKVCFTTGTQLPPADVNVWPMVTLSGKATTDLSWPGVSGETTVWLSCSFANTRMVHGPSSVPTSVRLPGNGLGTAAATSAEPAMKIAA